MILNLVKFTIIIMFKIIHKRIFMQSTYKFYDIAANLTDDQFSGKYYDKTNHQDDRH